MKKNLLFIALLTLCSLSVVGQSTLRTGYFLERMNMRHKLNPALINEYGYLSIPAIGNVSLTANSNLGLGKFIFPNSNGELVTFLDPSVSNDVFLAGLKDINDIKQNLELALISTGFYAFGGYNTLDISLKENVDFALPKQMFSFLKEGTGDFDLSNIAFDTEVYAEVALGHARKINDKLTAGVKLKFLMGGAYANVNLTELKLSMTEQQWTLMAQAEGRAALLGSPIEIDNEGNIDFGQLSPNIGGMGGAIDLGATYEIIDNLMLSASITNLGGILWNNGSNLGIKGGEVTIVDADDVYDIEDINKAIDEKIETITNEINKMIELESDENDSFASSLSPTLTIGAEYSFLNNMMSAGILSTTRFGGQKVFAEAMGVFNLTPLKWLNLSVSGAISTAGAYWGLLLNLAPKKGLNLFVGTDCMIGKVSPQFIPINASNINLNFGICIPIGRSSEHLRPIIKKTQVN